MEPLCSLCHLPQIITRRQDTLQVFSELVLFYRRWKDEEKESWNPCLGSRYYNFEGPAANSFSKNYSNSNLFNSPSAESVFHSPDLPIIPVPFLHIFLKHLIRNVVLEFQEKTLKFLLEINRKLSDLGRIYKPEVSMINIE